MADATGHSAPICSVELRHVIGLLALDIGFHLTQPWTVLFGPSGSGKTTVLRALAGLLHPDSALIASRHFNQRSVVVDTKAGLFVPAHLRNVRLAAQRTALFPHLTVKENILFGTRRRSGTTPREFADIAMEQFRLRGLAEALPAMLSGGERQRTAIARAVASAMGLKGGAILLLDEPFTGLDAKLRDELIADLRSSLVTLQIPVLSVTHDVGEAFQLGAEVIKIADGKVVEQGPVAVALAGERERLLRQLQPGQSVPSA